MTRNAHFSNCLFCIFLHISTITGVGSYDHMSGMENTDNTYPFIQRSSMHTTCPHFLSAEAFVIFCGFLLLYFWYIFFWEALWWKLSRQCLSINQKLCGENDVNFISVWFFEGVCQEVHLWVKSM